MESATWIALAGLVLSTAVNIALIVIGRRDRKADARRAYVEFSTRQQTEVASNVLFALRTRVRMFHEAAMWMEELKRAPRESRQREVAGSKVGQLLNDSIPKQLDSMDRAIAAARLTFSGDVIRHIEEMLKILNVAAFEGPEKLDVDQASIAGRALEKALREELLMAEVHEYQRDLFRKPDRRGWFLSWWESNPRNPEKRD